MWDGRVLHGVRYGAEPDDRGADDHPCRDCGAVKGQHHVHGLREVERCPNCDVQLASCDCEFDGDGDAAKESEFESAPTKNRKAVVARKAKRSGPGAAEDTGA